MISRRYGALLCLLWANVYGASPAHAESLDGIFHAANQAFARGDYTHASQQYQRVIDSGIRDPDVYLNLGLSEARNDALGRAVLAFEQSLRIRPGDSDATSALGLARAAIGKRHAQQHGEAVVETRPPLAEALVRPYREDTLAWLLLICDAALFSCLLGLAFGWGRSSDATRTGLAVAATLFALSSAGVGAGLFIKRGGLYDGAPAIVLRDGAELREAPDPRALVRAHAPEGGSARVIARDGGFMQVRTAAGPVGWVADADVGLVVD